MNCVSRHRSGPRRPLGEKQSLCEHAPHQTPQQGCYLQSYASVKLKYHLQGPYCLLWLRQLHRTQQPESLVANKEKKNPALRGPEEESL